MKSALKIYSLGWPVVLVAYWGGLLYLVHFEALSYWTAFSLSALGLVVALFLLSTVDLLVAINLAHKGQPYAPLPGKFPLQERLELVSWLIVPVGFGIGLYVGHQYW